MTGEWARSRRILRRERANETTGTCQSTKRTVNNGDPATQPPRHSHGNVTENFPLAAVVHFGEVIGSNHGHNPSTQSTQHTRQLHFVVSNLRVRFHQVGGRVPFRW
jgi:hypothetical protein